MICGSPLICPTDPTEQFRAAMEAAGLVPPDRIKADGKLHRCGTVDKPPGTDGCYLLHLDGWPAGGLQNWQNGGWTNWKADLGKKPTKAEQIEYKKRLVQIRHLREIETAKRRAEARERAAAIWSKAGAVSGDHAYLAGKGVQAHGVRLHQGTLVVPAADSEGQIHTLQFIASDGTKRFLAGGEKRAHWHMIGEPDSVICVAEGYATAASIHEATGYVVAVAFDCGNIMPVSEALAEHYPDARLVICADNDSETGSNPGMTKAREAARILDADLADPGQPGDFNDLHQAEGLEAVAERINASKPTPPLDELERYTVQAPGGNFSVSNRGVFWNDPEAETGKRAYVCSRVDVTARSRDTANEEWGRLLVFRDPEGVRHTWCLPMSMLAADGADMRRELLGKGMKISNKRKLEDYLQAANPKALARAVVRTGWESGGSYVLPCQVISCKDRDELVYLQSVSMAASRWYTSRGTLDEWRTNVAAPCVGNSRLTLAISAAFAAPLLDKLNAESGGIHFYGPSTAGKTTALRAACSVWGPKEREQSWRVTSNGLEGIAAAHNDSLLCLDEISQIDPREVGHTAYMLANGRGKGRSKRDGSMREAATWRLLFLSSGEYSMENFLRQSGRQVNAGQLVRFVDVPAVPDGSRFGLFESVPGSEDQPNPERGRRFADDLRQAAELFHGTAGPEFIRCLVQEDRLKLLHKYISRLRDRYTPAGASGQVQRVISRFALIAAAGELATTLGVTGWTPGTAASGVEVCLVDWLGARGTVGGHEEAELIERVTAFLQTQAARFQPWDGEQGDRIPPNRAGFTKTEGGVTKFYVFPKVFRDEVIGGVGSKHAGKVLAEAGMLERDASSRSFTKPVKLPGESKTQRVYVITQPTQQAEVNAVQGKPFDTKAYTAETAYTAQKQRTEVATAAFEKNQNLSNPAVCAVSAVYPPDSKASRLHSNAARCCASCVNFGGKAGGPAGRCSITKATVAGDSPPENYRCDAFQPMDTP